MSQHTCPSWFSFSLDNFLRKRFHDPAKILGSYIKPGSTVLDIGCGPGYFTIPMAQMTGETGTVFAVDLQENMLNRMLARADQMGIRAHIKAIRCRPDDIMVREKADFILTFWMVHEVRDPGVFFKQVASTMKRESRYLLVEPKFHVTGKKYVELIRLAEAAGLKSREEPAISWSRSILFSL